MSRVTSTILGDEKSQTEFKLKKGELFANTNGVLEGKIIEFNYIPRSGKRSKFHTLVRRVFTPYGNKVITQKLTDISKIESLARMATLAGVKGLENVSDSTTSGNDPPPPPFRTKRTSSNPPPPPRTTKDIVQELPSIQRSSSLESTATQHTDTQQLFLRDSSDNLLPGEERRSRRSSSVPPPPPEGDRSRSPPASNRRNHHATHRGVNQRDVKTNADRDESVTPPPVPKLVRIRGNRSSARSSEAPPSRPPPRLPSSSISPSSRRRTQSSVAPPPRPPPSLPDSPLRKRTESSIVPPPRIPSSVSHSTDGDSAQLRDSVASTYIPPPPPARQQELHPQTALKILPLIVGEKDHASAKPRRAKKKSFDKISRGANLNRTEGVSDLRVTNTNVDGGGGAQEDDDENEMYKQMKAILEAKVASGAITAGEKDVILSKLAKSQDEGMQMEIEDIPSYMYLPRCLFTDKIKDGYFSDIIGSGSYEDADVTPNAAVLMIDSLYKQVKELSLEISQMNAEFHSFLVKNEGASEVATEHLSNRVSVLAGYMEECDEVLVSKTKPSVLSRSGSSMNSNETASASPHSGSLGKNNNNTSTKATTEEYGWISKPARSTKPTANASPSRKAKERSPTSKHVPPPLSLNRSAPQVSSRSRGAIHRRRKRVASLEEHGGNQVSSSLVESLVKSLNQPADGRASPVGTKTTSWRNPKAKTQAPDASHPVLRSAPMFGGMERAIEKGNPEECKSSEDLRAKLLLPMASEGPRRLRLRERKIVGSNVTNSLESIRDDGGKDAKVRKNGKNTSMASDVGTFCNFQPILSKKNMSPAQDGVLLRSMTNSPDLLGSKKSSREDLIRLWIFTYDCGKKRMKNRELEHWLQLVRESVGKQYINFMGGELKSHKSMIHQADEVQQSSSSIRVSSMRQRRVGRHRRSTNSLSLSPVSSSRLNSATRPSMVVINLQNACSDAESQIKAILCSSSSPRFSLVKSTSAKNVTTLLFTQSSSDFRVSDIRTSSVNIKGKVDTLALSARVNDTYVCVANVLFGAKASMKEAYSLLVDNIKFSQSSDKAGLYNFNPTETLFKRPTLIREHPIVFVAGDLNSKIMEEKVFVSADESAGMTEKKARVSKIWKVAIGGGTFQDDLQQFDELHIYQENSSAFLDFVEPKISFGPTAHFKAKSNVLNPKLVPCWRHRIVHSSMDRRAVSNLNYAIGRLTTSTSRPISSCYLINTTTPNVRGSQRRRSNASRRSSVESTLTN